jgi:hypothetical protein
MQRRRYAGEGNLGRLQQIDIRPGVRLRYAFGQGAIASPIDYAETVRLSDALPKPLVGRGVAERRHRLPPDQLCQA